MKKLLARTVRVSPAMVVAMLALFVALTGTTVAASDEADHRRTDQEQLDQGHRRTKQVAHRQGLQRLRSRSTRTTRRSRREGRKGEEEIPALPNARAHAVVKLNATFLTGYTKNFTSVQRVSTGVYCLTPAPGIDSASSPSVVSPKYGIPQAATSRFTRGSRP